MNLKIHPANLEDAGVHSLKLKVYNAQVSPVERVFSIELMNPCDAIDLSIDDTVFKPLTEVSFSNYLTYAAKDITWTDDIVQSSV